MHEKKSRGWKKVKKSSGHFVVFGTEERGREREREGERGGERERERGNGKKLNQEKR